jgi:hypothetical protein
VTERSASGGDAQSVTRHATAYLTLERADTETGWRLVTFSLGGPL